MSAEGVTVEEPATFIMEDIYSAFGADSESNLWVVDLIFVIAWSIGIWKILWFLIGRCQWTGKHCCRGMCQKKNRTFTNYGVKGQSWAVVTGGSDGIGLAMCQKLAKEGFNICIISRTEEKINNCLKDISATSPNIQTKCIVADFGKLTKMSEYREIIQEPLKDLDIGVLVLNAGYFPTPIFEMQPDEYTENIVNINTLHVTYTLKALIE